MMHFTGRRSKAAGVAATAVVAVGALALCGAGGGTPHSAMRSIKLSGDSSQGTDGVLCSTTGPEGTWVISTTGIATLTQVPSASPPVPCASAPLQSGGLSEEIAQCASELAASAQQVSQEAATTLFTSFMKEWISHNSISWAEALVGSGYQGPAVPATSQEVSDAINSVWQTDYDQSDALVQALVALANQTTDASFDCSGDDPVGNWYSNQAQALGDNDEQINELASNLVHAIAGQIAQWGTQGPIDPNANSAHGGNTLQ
jgi:hypothetical protein